MFTSTNVKPKPLRRGRSEVSALSPRVDNVVAESVRRDQRARAKTPTHWICLGLHDSLDEAIRIAVRETIRFLGETRGLDPADAYALASVAVDFEVTQNVDGVKGIHAMIPKMVFKENRPAPAG